MNPLLSRGLPIPFDQIRTEHVVPAVRQALEDAQRELDSVVSLEGERSYANTIQALDDLGERLDRVISPVAHLVSVLNTPDLREAYDTVLPEFSAFYARLPLNPELWQAVKTYAETPEAQALSGVRRRHLEKLVREFIRAGADLSPEDKARVEAISIELSQLQTQFANNTLDATNAFELVVTDPEDLAGLPASARAQARASAEAKGMEGWRFTLQIPSYQPFMQYADNRRLREVLYDAYANRASGGDTDNRPLITRILKLRREMAGLLGYGDYADLHLEDSMVGNGAKALAFEEDLTERTRPFWSQEVEDLTRFARTVGLESLEPWDVAYVAEKLRRDRYDLDEEELRPYFQLDGVLAGLWEITRRLFGVTVTERANPEIWHPEVRFYEVSDETGTYLGGFYADWFPRETKRGGAWMNALLTGGPRENEWEPHVGLMVGNFTPPQPDGTPSLLTHREVETVFHEFGHLL
ncbi:MAG: M3 family metallopeptidase, partial [Gemmatimonadota bacterium]|nr:M3 family metallopeptidase [Gemmatimonadota bacterium]